MTGWLYRLSRVGTIINFNLNNEAYLRNYAEEKNTEYD
jgi:hypothetical protein